MVQAAKVARARRIIAVDPIAARGASVAGTLGATDLVDPGVGDPVEQVQALTGGRGADYVLEAATLASAQTQAILMSRRAGTVVLTSVERADATVTVPQVAIAVQSRAILSAQNGNCRMRHDLPALHPHDGGRLGHARADHHHPLSARRDQRGARTPRSRSATSAA